MWPPTQEVSMLQRASNWTFIRSEVLLNKIVCHPGLRGYDLLSGSTCDRIFIWKNTGSTMPSAHNSGSQKCFALVLTMVLEEGAHKWEKDMIRAFRIHLSCSPYLYMLEPDWPLHTYMVASSPDTTATGMNLPCGENQTHHPLPNACILC